MFQPHRNLSVTQTSNPENLVNLVNPAPNPANPENPASDTWRGTGPRPNGNRVDGISSVGQDRQILTHSESGDSELRLGEN